MEADMQRWMGGESDGLGNLLMELLYEKCIWIG